MPTNIYDKWKPGETYSFNTIAPGVLPSPIQRVKLESTGSYRMATQVGTDDLYTQWRRLYPHLPPGTVDNPSAHLWYTFVSMDDKPIVLAEPWIDGSSVVPIDFINAAITITETSSSRISKIIDMLNQMGEKFEVHYI